ncbi:MAG: VWA domain-containing protein [Lachnospiraceae bacterium]|nr:VWA domain-containing protein [Lachnospiraceae bacterium]
MQELKENRKSEDSIKLNRWRLMLGKYADSQVGFSKDGIGAGPGAGGDIREMDDVLDFIYSREYGEEEGVREQAGGLGESVLTVTTWVNKVRELFPKETVEIMEKQALERYKMTELLTDSRVLEKLNPNKELLGMILNFKGLMKPEVLATAKRIVKKVVDELMEKLNSEIKRSITGQIDKTQDSPVKSSRNLDIKRTIMNNLKHYDREKRRLVLEKVFFYSRIKKYQQWKIIVCVDESGSMLDSVIHSAIMAGIFAKLPMLDTKLVIFDTNVVDLSDYVEDPVETLMSVQLGGGTEIGRALSYCESLVTEPEKTIMVLVTDLYEGGELSYLYSTTAAIVESGVKLMVLTALDDAANPNYNKNAAAKMAGLGANVAAMTPGKLAAWVGEVMKEG